MSKLWSSVSFHRASILKACANLLSYATFAMITPLGTVASGVGNYEITLGVCLKFTNEISKEIHIFRIRGTTYFFACEMCLIHAQ